MSDSRSLFPGLYRRNWRNSADRVSSIYGPELFDSDLYPSILRRGSTLYPLTHAAMQSSGELEVKHDGKFRVVLDVRHFKPGEIVVKVVDKFIVVHCKHAEKFDDHGFVQREFTRRYMLPEEAEAETVKSMCANGILTIEVSKKEVAALPSNERVIPIEVFPKSSEKETSD